MSRDSTSATSSPRWSQFGEARRPAQTSPAGPPPITITSNSRSPISERKLSDSGLDLEYDLPGRAAAVDQLECLGRPVEREPRTNDWAHVAAVDQLLDRRADLDVHLRLRHHVGAPAGADHLDVVQEKPVDLQLGDRAAGESDDHHATLLAQCPHAVEEAIAADGVDHDVHAAAAQLLRLVLPGAVGSHHLVG